MVYVLNSSGCPKYTKPAKENSATQSGREELRRRSMGFQWNFENKKILARLEVGGSVDRETNIPCSNTHIFENKPTEIGFAVTMMSLFF